MSRASERKNRLAAEQKRRADASRRASIRAAAMHPDPDLNEPEVIGGWAWSQGLEERLAHEGYSLADWDWATGRGGS